LHGAALELLLPAQAARLVAEVQSVLKSRTIPEKQHALALLAQAATPAADAILLTYADTLVTGTCSAELKLDVLDAARARATANPNLAAKVAAYTVSAAGVAQSELLLGGSVLAGREVVQNNLNANCLACHGLESNGGSEVGPNLSTIGSQRDHAYLLESLLVPNANIATGYGLVSVTLKDGSVVAGTIARDMPQSVGVRLFDGTNRTLARADIVTQTPPVSIMPPMLGILQPREVRDVVAFLAAQKPRPRRGATGTAAPDGGL